MKNLPNWFWAIVLCCLFIQKGFGQQKGTFTATLNEWSSDPELACASLAFYAVDLKSGSTVENFNGEKAMIPASLMKLSTTIAAVELLGADFAFSTGFYHDGFVDEEGTLQGNLYLTGNGDPTFGSKRLGERPDWLIARFSESIRKMGIRKVSGDVVVEQGAVESAVPGTWTWEDLANYYAAIPHRVNFIDNEFSMVFKTGSAGSAATLISITPEIPGLQIENRVFAANVQGDKTFCYGHPLGNEIEVRGELPENRSAFTVKGAIPNPGFFFASKVMDAAANLGVQWEGDMRSGSRDEESAILMFQHSSPPMMEIVRETNDHSVNLFAEALVVAIGKEGGHEEGLETIATFWSDQMEDGGRGMNLKDGSGLSHYNTITARQLAEMLQFAHGSDYRMHFEQSLALAGQSGTLRNFGKGTSLEGKMRAKSGYMTRNRGYAGYMTLASGRKIAFALLANHYDISAASMRLKMEDLLQRLAASE